MNQELKVKIGSKASLPIIADITISAQYNDQIIISIHDRTSGQRFLEMSLTREQFINAAMCRLGNAEIESAVVTHLERVGKKMEMNHVSFEMPRNPLLNNEKKIAREIITDLCKCGNQYEGWIPDLGFSSQDSFFSNKEKRFARTTIRRWVEDTKSPEHPRPFGMVGARGESADSPAGSVSEDSRKEDKS